MAEAAANVGSGGARGKSDGFASQHQFGGGQADAAFFRCVALLASQERAVVAKWLVEERFDQLGAAVGAADESTIFKASQIAADAWRRGAGFGEDLIDTGATRAEQELDDLLGSMVNGLGHACKILFGRASNCQRHT